MKIKFKSNFGETEQWLLKKFKNALTGETVAERRLSASALLGDDNIINSSQKLNEMLSSQRSGCSNDSELTLWW